MPRNYAAVDHVEPVHDTMMEQFGNERDYHWDSGCEVSYSSTDLVVSVAEGSVTLNGSDVSVAADTVTLVADGSNPRWSWVAVDSTGDVVLVSGTAASDPTVPELGDYVELALIRIEAGQTIASACEHKLDKRMKGKTVIRVVSSDGSTTVSLTSDATATASFGTVSGFTLPLSASSKYLFKAILFIQAPSAGGGYYASINPPGGSSMHLYTMNGATIGRDNAFNLGTFTANEKRTLVLHGSIVTTTAGNFTYSHLGKDFKVRAHSRIELL